MPFKKGQSGNPNGRPKGSLSVDDLLRTISRVEKRKGRKKILEHFVERAYENDKVLIALMKKILPDKKDIEHGLNEGSSAMVESIMDLIDGNSRGLPKKRNDKKAGRQVLASQ